MPKGGAKFDIVGEEEVIRRLKSFQKQNRRAAAAVLNEEAEIDMTSMKELVPVDLGDLRASGHVGATTILLSKIETELGFGDEAADYAAAVHEDLEAHHDDGEAKYVEKVLMDSVRTLGKRVAEGIIRKQRTMRL